MSAEIDLTNAARVYDQLSAALTLEPAVIIADFTATAFCDSAGLHQLIMIHKRAAARNVQLRLVVPSAGSVRHVLELIGLDQQMPVYPTIAQATGLFSAPRPKPLPSYSPRHDARQERRAAP